MSWDSIIERREPVFPPPNAEKGIYSIITASVRRWRRSNYPEPTWSYCDRIGASCALFS